MKTINLRKAPLTLAIATIGLGVGNSALAANFETEGGIKGSFDSTISYGVQRRMKSPDTSIVGNDSGGNVPTSSPLGAAVNGLGFAGTANPDFNYANADDGNLNYKKGDIVSSVLKGTHELSLKQEGDWAALGRFTWSSDFAADKTRRTPLDDEAKKTITANISLLDLWVSKGFSLGGNTAKLKFGNQVISWGEDIFIVGGVNSINALDLRKIHIPGVQLKEIFVPAPMLSFSSSLGSGFSTEAYYQFRWNKVIFDPVGTYWSSVDIVGKGGKRGAFIPSSFVGAPVGTYGDFDPTRGRTLEGIQGLGGLGTVEQTSPKNSGQYGLNLRFKPKEGDTEYAAYYIRYHDKLPFVGYRQDLNAAGACAAAIPACATSNIGGYTAIEQYGEDKSLFGFSLNTKLGDWAIGAEISYRPRDSVAIDPTIGNGGGAGFVKSQYDLLGLALASPTGVATVNGYVNEKKWQAHLTGFNLLSRELTRPLGAAEGYIMGEVAVTHYPGLDLSGAIPYLLNNYTLPTKTSWGFVAEFGLTYANVLNSGWTFSPIVDYYKDVKGTSPNTLPFVEGRTAVAVSLNFDYHNKTKIGIGYTTFSGGGNLNMMRNRDVLSANVSYSF